MTGIVRSNLRAARPRDDKGMKEHLTGFDKEWQGEGSKTSSKGFNGAALFAINTSEMRLMPPTISSSGTITDY